MTSLKPFSKQEAANYLKNIDSNDFTDIEEANRIAYSLLNIFALIEISMGTVTSKGQRKSPAFHKALNAFNRQSHLILKAKYSVSAKLIEDKGNSETQDKQSIYYQTITGSLAFYNYLSRVQSKVSKSFSVLSENYFELKYWTDKIQNESSDRKALEKYITQQSNAAVSLALRIAGIEYQTAKILYISHNFQVPNLAKIAQNWYSQIDRYPYSEFNDSLMEAVTKDGLVTKLHFLFKYNLPFSQKPNHFLALPDKKKLRQYQKINFPTIYVTVRKTDNVFNTVDEELDKLLDTALGNDKRGN